MVQTQNNKYLIGLCKAQYNSQAFSMKHGECFWMLFVPFKYYKIY
jgi:beta-carotene 3-hydroxylase